MDKPIDAEGAAVLTRNELSFVRNWNVGSLEGKLLTLIETIGLPEKQENAIKSFARTEIWSWRDELISVPEDVENFWNEKHCRIEGK
jgi:hypothetical protein